mmetsp:Transcript_29181/g.64729  ORF Transcript_29181/g.64729 Transcript_29181/m.64729 type:complete len:161 (-) Transcript_29181:1554-2036(-)|eukprot:CAMPEP_0178472376 /NCGR_PEP_ID=MMETSP0696-20121128/1537_1 /TAXON_ID=265572 /ORGANISM="Extubocellulus spinifer, Strain CCMP396" /LENGTH=160 /DNA_ID=CAMNT_0020099561 /DNA_START=24 /DNA_END=506 /DNA_ORIENTATION=+
MSNLQQQQRHPVEAAAAIRYRRAHAFLRVVIYLVAIYGTGMVVAGRTFAVTLFDVLNFGPNAKSIADDGVTYSIFCFGVLGAVIVGWMQLMLCVLDMAKRSSSCRVEARRAMMSSAVVWFALDTGFSLVTEEIEHAIFNLPFFGLLIGPLYVMSVNDVRI